MMLDEMRFSVLVIDGHYSTADQMGSNTMFYDNLSWAEATELMRLSFIQGFEIVVMRLEDE